MKLELTLPDDIVDQFYPHLNHSGVWARFEHVDKNIVKCFEIDPDKYCPSCEGTGEAKGVVNSNILQCMPCEGWKHPILSISIFDLQRGLQLALNKHPHLINELSCLLEYHSPENGMTFDGLVQLCTIGEVRYG